MFMRSSLQRAAPLVSSCVSISLDGLCYWAELWRNDSHGYTGFIVAFIHFHFELQYRYLVVLVVCQPSGIRPSPQEWPILGSTRLSLPASCCLLLQTPSLTPAGALQPVNAGSTYTTLPVACQCLALGAYFSPMHFALYLLGDCW